ncbi:MAG: hypothetical protein Tsb002_33580 [Wenzhouxiangellaceae bacterium]
MIKWNHDFAVQMQQLLKQQQDQLLQARIAAYGDFRRHLRKALIFSLIWFTLVIGFRWMADQGMQPLALLLGWIHVGFYYFLFGFVPFILLVAYLAAPLSDFHEASRDVLLRPLATRLGEQFRYLAADESFTMDAWKDSELLPAYHEFKAGDHVTVADTADTPLHICHVKLDLRDARVGSNTSGSQRRTVFAGLLIDTRLGIRVPAEIVLRSRETPTVKSKRRTKVAVGHAAFDQRFVVESDHPATVEALFDERFCETWMTLSDRWMAAGATREPEAHLHRHHAQLAVRLDQLWYRPARLFMGRLNEAELKRFATQTTFSLQLLEAIEQAGRRNLPDADGQTE